MKISSILAGVCIALSGITNTPAMATELPTVESFLFTPTAIELQGSSTTVDFELTVSHPLGIENLSSFVTLKDPRGSTWGFYLTRTDFPVVPELKRVVFKGSFTLPRSVAAGVYSVSATEVKNNSRTNYSYGTGTIFAKNIRDLIGAESSLLIRNGGELNYEFPTFQGPSYDTTISINYKDPNKYNSRNPPIWKVGEQFNPIDYFEKRVSYLELQVKTLTPAICSSDGKILRLIAEGSCNFVAYTIKTNDFALYEKEQTVQVTGARVKPSLFISKIENQTAKDLPKSLTVPQVYSAAEGFLLPKTSTPSICVPSGFTVRLISGGTCILTYQTAATSTYLASDVYQQSFEITRGPQTISFTPPVTANLSAKTLALSATASGGGVITYQTTSTGICSITGSTLNLLKSGNCAITATQAGSATLAPISATATVMIAGSVAPTKKTITCVKGNKTKKVSGANPKCPKGYKVKR